MHASCTPYLLPGLDAQSLRVSPTIYTIYIYTLYQIYIKGFLIHLNNISIQFSCSVVTLWEQEWKGIWKVNTCRGVNNFGCKMDVIFHVQKISIYMEGFIRKRTRI